MWIVRFNFPSRSAPHVFVRRGLLLLLLTPFVLNPRHDPPNFSRSSTFRLGPAGDLEFYKNKPD